MKGPLAVAAAAILSVGERIAVLSIVIVAGGLGIYAALTLFSWIVRRNVLYEATIRAFERERVPEGAIVFVGSSSIRFWDGLAGDFAPRAVVNRGFGGAVVSQAVHFAPRIFAHTPSPRAIVLYCGGNDLAWGVSVDDVLAGIERFVEHARAAHPGAVVYVCSVAKTPSRFLSFRRVERLNLQLPARVEAKGARFVDLTTPMLDERRRPRRELFIFDGIHPSHEGYAVWRRVLSERFDADLGW